MLSEMEIKQSTIEKSEENVCDEKQETGNLHYDISYQNFFENYMLKNIPCIIKNITSTWVCANKWIKNDIIDYNYLIEHYGDLEAPVADCDDITFNAHCKTNMKVKHYMNYLQDPKKEKILYLKDWHLKRLRPDDQFYEVPLIFRSDWLNEYAYDRQEDDFMFVYIGPKDSWTPLHVDVYNSYSWSVNVIGRKKWILFRPGEEGKLKDSFGNLPVWFTPEKFPDVQYLELVQDKGDALFVPSGWHHQVTNLLDTISVNHNWVNACNIEYVWSGFLDCMELVENEIKDLKETPEFTAQCQIILKSLFGMDFSDYVKFVIHIGKKRMNKYKEFNEKTETDSEIGISHIRFDLKKLYKIMNLIQSHYLFSYKILSSDIENVFIDTKNSILELL